MRYRTLETRGVLGAGSIMSMLFFLGLFGCSSGSGSSPSVGEVVSTINSCINRKYATVTSAGPVFVEGNTAEAAFVFDMDDSRKGIIEQKGKSKFKRSDDGKWFLSDVTSNYSAVLDGPCYRLAPVAVIG